MYRLKEAIVIFWAVLTHKYYLFFSIKDGKDGKRVGRAHQFNSDEVERDTPISKIFLESVQEFVIKHASGKYNRYVKKDDNERKRPEK